MVTPTLKAARVASAASTTGLSIMRLIPNPPGKIVNGEIVFNGSDVLKMSEEQVRSIRGNDIVYKQYYDIGVAVGTEEGLVVPIVRKGEAIGVLRPVPSAPNHPCRS